MKHEYKIFVFDTETTWTDTFKDRIIQFSWILWTLTTDERCQFTFREERTINEFVNIEWDIPEEASKIHGIYKKDIENCKDISFFIDDLADIINSVDFFVWHNVEFDLDMIESEERRIRSWEDVLINAYDVAKIDTMKSSTEIVNWKWWKWPKLSELYKFLFYHDFQWAHDSLSDVKATLECFLELAKRYRLYDAIFYPWLINDNYNMDGFRRLLDNWYIDYLQYVSDEQFEYIMKNIDKYMWYWSFSMKGLKQINNKQAELLKNNCKWDRFNFSWLQKVNDFQAWCLSHLLDINWRDTETRKHLYLDWLTSLTDNQAFYLIGKSSYRAKVSLQWLTKITDKQAEYIANPDMLYSLYFPNLETISEKQAKTLIKTHTFIYVSSKFKSPVAQEKIWHYYSICDNEWEYERRINRIPMPDDYY